MGEWDCLLDADDVLAITWRRCKRIVREEERADYLF